MERNRLIWLGVAVGSAFGGYVPSLIWGDSIFSVYSVIGTGIGGFIGIYLAWKISE